MLDFQQGEQRCRDATEQYFFAINGTGDASSGQINDGISFERTAGQATKLKKCRGGLVCASSFSRWRWKLVPSGPATIPPAGAGQPVSNPTPNALAFWLWAVQPLDSLLGLPFALAQRVGPLLSRCRSISSVWRACPVRSTEAAVLTSNHRQKRTSNSTKTANLCGKRYMYFHPMPRMMAMTEAVQ